VRLVREQKGDEITEKKQKEEFPFSQKTKGVKMKSTHFATHVTRHPSPSHLPRLPLSSLLSAHFLFFKYQGPQDTEHTPLASGKRECRPDPKCTELK